MNKVDREYTTMLRTVKALGDTVQSRNSEVRSFINLSTTFYETPLISIRTTAWKNALKEFEWFMTGSNNVLDLDESVRHWWTPFADSEGTINNSYGSQFRYYNGHMDQIETLVNGIITNPTSRRNIITTWQTEDMNSPETSITNCHGTNIAVYCREGIIKLVMTQRSADMLLGVPHNWIQYWAFGLWLAAQTDRTLDSFDWIGLDCHIYKDHLEAAQELITELKHHNIETPTLVYNGKKGYPFKASDFDIVGKYIPIIKTKLNMTV